MEDLSRLPRGFHKLRSDYAKPIKASSGLLGTVDFSGQSPSRLRRGFIEAFKSCWFSYGRSIEASSRLSKTQVWLCETNQGIVDAFVNCWFFYAEPIEASSRLNRALQNLLVLYMEDPSRLPRGFQKSGVILWNQSRHCRGACSQALQSCGATLCRGSCL